MICVGIFALREIKQILSRELRKKKKISFGDVFAVERIKSRLEVLLKICRDNCNEIFF
jgi:hypothetical protein